MPTDNPKISLYVPQQIYDRFKTFQEERKLSMSQAGIVILAEYFGIEETIKEIIEGTTVGGITLSEFEQLKQRIEQLEKRVEQNETTSKPLIKNQNIDRLITSKLSSSAKQDQLELIRKNVESISVELLAKRLGIKNPKTISNKKSEVYKNSNPNAENEFCEWSRQKDLDAISWRPIKEGRRTKYVPTSELSEELLSKLQTWISQNT